ncbi:hypothetical protein [Peribacillus frigoritolerans]
MGIKMDEYELLDKDAQDAEPHGIASGPDGAIWFAEECNKIARLSLL